MNYDFLDDAALIGPRERYNPAMIRHGGETLLVYRTGMYYEGRLFLGRLDAGYRPVKGSFRELQIRVPPYHSFEDPRFFHHRGRLYLYFSGITCRPFAQGPLIGPFDRGSRPGIVKSALVSRQTSIGKELGLLRLRRQVARHLLDGRRPARRHRHRRRSGPSPLRDPLRQPVAVGRSARREPIWLNMGGFCGGSFIALSPPKALSSASWAATRRSLGRRFAS